MELSHLFSLNQKLQVQVEPKYNEVLYWINQIKQSKNQTYSELQCGPQTEEMFFCWDKGAAEGSQFY